MKKITTLLCACMLLTICSTKAQTEAEMKAWESYMTPGELHKMLAEAAGDWNEDITMWVDPAAPPIKSTATSKIEMIMGGRYQSAKTTGDMMGMPFEGMSLMGYDNTTKLFTSTWVDNFGTGTLTMVGTWDAPTLSITLKGKMIDPMTGKDVLTKQIIKFIDKNRQEMEMYDTKNGKETKTMAVKSTRKK